MAVFVETNVPGTNLELTFTNDMSCCGLWELSFENATEVRAEARCKHGFNHTHTVYDDGGPAYYTCRPSETGVTKKLPPLKPLLAKIFKEVVCTSNHGYSGVKGAGMVMVNLIVKAPESETTQEKLIPLVKKMGFREVRDYYNPRSGCTLRLFLATGKEIAKALSI